jgi:hypothetical protein
LGHHQAGFGAQMIVEHSSEQVVASRSSFSEQALPLAVQGEVAGGDVVGPQEHNEGEEG